MKRKKAYLNHENLCVLENYFKIIYFYYFLILNFTNFFYKFYKFNLKYFVLFAYIFKYYCYKKFLSMNYLDE